MDYKQIAVKNENKLKNENERLKTLLYNALDLLKTQLGIDEVSVSIEDTELLEELGMTEKEYNKIMGE